jgi:PelA/Pel-15E family pectate lyase
MSLREPSPAVRAAVHTGIATLHELARSDLAWGKVNEADGRRLTQQPGAGPLWARYYDLSTHQPIFGDRDKSLHDDVNEVSLERRNGYAWWGIWPRKTLTAYEAWAKRWPAAR